MKKLMSLIMVMAVMMACSISAMATEVDFVPSISNKGAPELVITYDANGKMVIGHIFGGGGSIISTEYKDCLVITSVYDAKTSTTIPEDAKEELLKVFDELNADDAKLSKICPELNDIVKDELGDDWTADDLVVRDLFDITGLCDDLNIELPKDGNTIELKFDLSLPKDAFITAMAYVDGSWQPIVETVNNGDGTITCVFEDICPVAFLTTGSGTATNTPSTDTNVNPDSVVTGSTLNNIILWSVVLLMSLSVIIAMVVYNRKRNADN